ncbi:MAG: hypothetical protein AAGJ87_12200 [Pseudomonadota bacterium]
MFGWFKSRPRKRLDLEARLKPTTAGGPYGDVEVQVFDDGSWDLEIELKNQAGTADVALHVDGARVGSFAARAGETEFRRSDRDGVLGFDPQVGQAVSLHAEGRELCAGVFHRD